MTSVTSLELLGYVVCGLLFGAAYFYLLLRTSELHISGAALGHILPLYFLRLALAMVLFWAVAQRGALPLLLTMTGFLVMRIAFQRLTTVEQ